MAHITTTMCATKQLFWIFFLDKDSWIESVDAKWTLEVRQENDVPHGDGLDDRECWYRI